MAESRVWFSEFISSVVVSPEADSSSVTGASTGFGRILTEYLLKQDDRVVATLRKPEVLSDLVSQYSSSRLVVAKVDVTRHAEISAAFEKAQEAFGRIDVVFNNAGKMINGELESVNDEHARELFEINFWGAAQVSREAVRFFRDVNQPQGGRLLQVSSGMGIASRACYAHYSASKFALEGLTEALADELNPAWNIKITILEPGPFRTEITTANSNVAPPHPAYAGHEMPGSKWRTVFKSGISMDGDPQKACFAFEKASRLEDPPIRLPLHRRVLDLATKKGKSLIEAAEKYKDWSDDLYL